MNTRKLFLIVLLTKVICFSAAASGQQDAEKIGNEAVELELWDYWADVPAMDRLIEAFESDHPGITILRTTMRDNDLRTTIRPALTSGSGPDVFSFTPGPGYVGVLSEAGLLMNLDPIYEARGWGGRFFPWVLEDVTHEGKKYAVGTEVTTLGVYYNRALFRSEGLNVPEQYSDFVQAAEAFRGTDIIPVMIDSKDQWPTFHFESMFYSAFAEKDRVGKILTGTGSFNQPVFAEALDRFYELISSGLTPENPNAYAYSDANTIFKSGKAAMRMTGSWMVREFVETLGDDVGFFPLPAVEGLSTAPPAGIGTVWCISEASEKKEAAVEFIDFILSPENIAIWYEEGVIPPVLIEQDIASFSQLTPLFIDVVAILQKGVVSYNLDVYLEQNVNEATLTYMQELIAGRIDGAQAVERKQAALEASR